MVKEPIYLDDIAFLTFNVDGKAPKYLKPNITEL